VVKAFYSVQSQQQNAIPEFISKHSMNTVKSELDMFLLNYSEDCCF